MKTTRSREEALKDTVIITLAWVLFLTALALILSSPRIFAQGAGAVRAQEIYSSTHHVKIDNTVGSAVVTVPYASAETFDANNGNNFENTITGNVASSTLTDAVSGEQYMFSICQDSAGSHTFAWPANVTNAPSITSTASKCTNVSGFYDGTNFNITGRWDTTSTSGGSVTSVAMTGDGVVFESTVPGSPVTSSGTLAPSLVPVLPDYFLGGPIGSAGSNVAFKASLKCTSVSTNATCSLSGLMVGDAILIVSGTQSYWTGGTTDTLGTTFTDYGGASTVHRAFGITTAAGNDTITLHTTADGTNGDAFWIVVLSGVSAYNDGNSFVISQTAISSGSTISHAVTPSASTDTYLIVAETDQSSFPPSGMTINPSSIPVGTFSMADGAYTDTGIGALNAPGSTSSITYGATFIGSGTAHAELFILDLAQNSSASTAPPAYRQITESDLPASAISAIQSVQTFTLAADVSVTSGVDTTGLSGTITMPSQGCPCRVLVQGSMFWSASIGSTAWGWWASDGTNTFGYGLMIPTDDTTIPAAIASMSPVSYGNNQSVTFSLHFEGSFTGGTVTIKSTVSPPLPTGAKTWMTLTVMQSRN